MSLADELRKDGLPLNWKTDFARPVDSNIIRDPRWIKEYKGPGIYDIKCRWADSALIVDAEENAFVISRKNPLICPD